MVVVRRVVHRRRDQQRPADNAGAKEIFDYATATRTKTLFHGSNLYMTRESPQPRDYTADRARPRACFTKGHSLERTMRMVRPWLCMALLLIAASPVADAEPKSDLDQIKIISYATFMVGDDQQRGKCRIGHQAWDTALEFVANQSTRLKIITFNELMANISKRTFGNSEEGRKYAAMPQLHSASLW
jgi:hypothetical protein